MTTFYIGLHIPQHAHRFERCMISVNVLRRRRSDFTVNEWMLDSGAFTELFHHGHYRDSVETYAKYVQRWKSCGNMISASAQDYMCEPFILDRTGLSVAEHQRLTIERYDALVGCNTGAYILPVLQGYRPSEYQDHIAQYGVRLARGAWVGVGSVCKRNAKIDAIEAVLLAIKEVRPDLRLHGFGVKKTALASSVVRECLHTADSMAWSFAARKEGRDANSWHEAKRYVNELDIQPVQRRTAIRQLDLF